VTKTERVEKELQALRDELGLLVPHVVVEWARVNTESALHSQFEWDDSKAAEEYRIWQARRVIAVYVVADGGERKFVSLSIDRKRDGGGYRDVEVVLKDEELRKVLVRDALMELKRVRAKYEHVKELASVYVEIDKADKQYGEQPQQLAA
jgi:hypothetical protein